MIVCECRFGSKSFGFDSRLDLSPEVDLICRIKPPSDASSIWPRTENAVGVDDAIDVGKEVRSFASRESSGGAQPLQGDCEREVVAERLVHEGIQGRIIERRPPAIGHIDLPASGKR